MNLMDLMIAIGIEDNASSELSKITGNAKKTAQSIGNGIANAVKVGSAAIAGMTAGVGALTKLSIDGFSQYEQLAGGVETLFKNSADQIKAYSDAAYKTAGMSANQYMDTAIKSSAALIRSLNGDTAKAAEIANMAITDMADNANKMGTSLQSLQNAYTGFSRGNFTMLDNLALGFSGTKEGMEELLATAKELTGIDYNIDSYADIVQAIHEVQEAMEITGTTAKEAAGTISGSMASAKAAWDNFLTGLADGNADIGQLTDNLVDSVATVADNLMPRIGQAVDGIITAFGNLIGIDLSGVAEKVGQFGEKTIDVAKNIMGAFKDGGVFGVFGEITEMFQQVTGIDVSFVTEKFDAVATAIGNIRAAFGEEGFEGGLSAFIEEFAGLTGVDISGFVSGVEWLITTVSSAAPEILDSVGKGLQGILEPFQEHGGEIITAIGGAIQGFLDLILNADHSWIASVGVGIGKVMEPIVGAIPEVIENVKNGVQSFLNVILGSDGSALAGIGDSIVTIFSPITDAVAGALESISGYFADIMDYAETSSFGDNLRSIAGAVTDLIGNFASDTGGLIRSAAEAIGYFGSQITKKLIDDTGTLAGNLSTISSVLNYLSDNFGSIVGPVTDMLDTSVEANKLLDAYEAEEISEEEYLRMRDELYRLASQNMANRHGNVYRSEENDVPIVSIPDAFIDPQEQRIIDGLAGDDPTLRRGAYTNGRAIADGIRQGIVDGLSSSDPTLRRGFDDLDDTVRDLNEINSPSRRYARIGMFMAQGISVGWLDAMKSVKRDISESMNFDTGNIPQRDSIQATTLRDSVRDILSGLVTLEEPPIEGAGVPIVLELDGEKIAHGIFNPLQSEYRRRGAKLGVAIE